ncbi:FAD-binding and (Fe-S)-binding domain-containing protein [Tautonia sociabilis]|uniref:FAD-binding oxidoreductase n=1 Tax=Tautonia sociabilis TaxID=2080755 RepID=A0A432MQ93_9BACT|nr:FAD-binding and (Fe-S)-binding domain-containing protein [Tautonia sociabilis]RUL89225.1 FAD-binding oxidoreductase [Tautonia sociabilis]
MPSRTAAITPAGARPARPLVDRLRRRLADATRAEIRFDPASRGLYATDASLYQIMPVGVVLPRTVDDVAATVRIAAEEGVPVVPRGGATSLSGQTIGAAIIIDTSKYLTRIDTVDRDRMTVRVQPGVVLGRLNAELKPLGLMFGPDVSTTDRATLGGMIGNNSAGARSLRFGKTVDSVRSLDVVLSDGTATTLGPLSPEELARTCARGDLVGRIHRTVRDLVQEHEPAIRQQYPRILRRVSGYNLDEFVPGLPVRAPEIPDEPWAFNLAKLVVGSEGTLAVVTGAELLLVPAPKHQGLVVLSFATIPAALDRVEEMIGCGPVAVEMVDRAILDLAGKNPEYARSLSFAAGHPEAVLAAQFYADTLDELTDKTSELARRFEGAPGVLGIRTTLQDAAKDDFWKVRKAGLSLLMGMVGDPKPVAFVEDTAVAVERLPVFYERFRAIVNRHGTVASCYGHADVGCLHIRPILNMKTQEGVDALRSIAAEVSDLVLEFGGAMSGEHGDGLARSRWNRKLFGEEIYGAFRTVKEAFDPHDLLNPGKVVAEPDPGVDLRYGPAYRTDREPGDTGFDFSDQGGFARAVELCSGVGACRKTGTGTMCPSYMVTRDEDHSTRGRANLMRLVMSGALPAEGLASGDLDRALDLCLQCKACKTECPSNVDMSRIKSEYLYQKYRSRPAPIGALLVAHVHLLNALGSASAPLSNWMRERTSVRWLLEKIAGFDRRRVVPGFERDHLRRWFRRHAPDPRAGTRGRVVLLDDCFTTFNTPAVGRAAVRVLEAAGYSVRLAGLPCCGRPAISKGLLGLARSWAEGNVAKLAAEARRGVPILGCEPSCILTLADEYRAFRLGRDADLVAGASMMIDRFLADRDRVPELPLRPREGSVLLHGHCQQKAIVGTADTVEALRRIPGLEVRTLDSGCCGMAGSFGYELGHYDVSVALAERVLLPAARAEPEAPLLAPGFSCRSQVHGLEGIDAIHPIELIAAQLDTAPEPIASPDHAEAAR